MKNKKLILISWSIGLVLGLTSIVLAQGNGSVNKSDFTFSTGPKAPVANKGDEKDLSVIRKRIVEIFKSDYDLSNLSPKAQMRIGLGEDGPAVAKLTKELNDSWTPSQAKITLDAILQLFKEENGQGLDLTFEKSHYVVDEWQGIQIDGDTATALFVGHGVLTRANGDVLDDKEQWLVNFEKIENRWLMDSRRGVKISNG